MENFMFCALPVEQSQLRISNYDVILSPRLILMELFFKTYIFIKPSIIDAWQDPKYNST